MDKPYYMTPAPDVEAAEDEDGLPIVRGMAVDYNRVAYFGRKDRVAVAPGAAAKRLEARLASKQRDVLALIAHDPGRPIGRTANGSLKFEDTEEGLTYTLSIDTNDPEAVSAHAKVKSGVMDSASIGFFVREASETKMSDNSPDSPAPGEEVDVELASDIDIFEVSLVPHGAMGGASAFTASAYLEGAVQDDEEPDTVESDESADDPESLETTETEEPPGDTVSWREASEAWARLGIITRSDINQRIGA